MRRLAIDLLLLNSRATRIAAGIARATGWGLEWGGANRR